MPLYKIPCSWEMFGVMKVEANNLTEAIEMAEDDCEELPEGNYVDASFRVDYELLEQDEGRHFGLIKYTT